MNKISLTILSLVVMVLGQVVRGAGIEIADEALTTTLVTGTQILGAFGVWYGRYRKGGINALGLRK